MAKDIIVMSPSHITHDLSKLPWQLSGWLPQSWLRGSLMELGIDASMDVAPVAAQIPGSVQQALYNAGLVPDWNMGLKSRQCEWVENRHWVFETTLPAEWVSLPGRKRLRCDGLDYRGVVLVNGTEAGTFCGSMAPHIFDLTVHLKAGDNKLWIVFNGVPDYLGQLCWTSQIKDWKPRFNFGWDWTPRLVQIGIWDAVHLEIDQGDCFESIGLYADYSTDSGIGTVMIHADLTIAAATHVEIVLKNNTEIIKQETIVATHQLVHQFRAGPVVSWQPNGNGLPTLYHLQINLLDAAGRVLDSDVRRIGFRQIGWKPCAGAPADARPWVCNINGVDTFLQGFNWVPLRSNFADVTVAEYRQRLETYRAMGTNLLRVWGGAVLERECFYDLCDQMGILVWQEFPMSSSGLDNWPPEDVGVISEMKTIAASYIQRRQHHPSLLLWCGGNELQGSLDGGKVGTGKPVDSSHPMLKMLEDLVRHRDPTRRFLPTSSSGPRFMAAKEDFGKGIHHDVHGPWNHTDELAGWFDYWNHDDALFRSETGMPGASSAELIRTFGESLAWPGNRTNPYWMHVCSWWMQWKEYIAAGGDSASLEAYVRWSQVRQAAALAHAANACKSRFPACGGIIIWMGHDAFPCPANTSVIDFLGQRKPAADALAKVFLNKHGSAQTKGTSDRKGS